MKGIGQGRKEKIYNIYHFAETISISQVSSSVVIDDGYTCKLGGMGVAPVAAAGEGRERATVNRTVSACKNSGLTLQQS